MAQKRASSPGDLSSGWETFEFIERNTELTPFSTALACGGEMPTPAITKMRMVEEIGWPEAKRALKDSKGHPLIVKKDEVIWLLKCKPSCWRLYFYVNQSRIIYLHAVCKKADAEDPNDAKRARKLHDSIGPTGGAITAFEFPAG